MDDEEKYVLPFTDDLKELGEICKTDMDAGRIKERAIIEKFILSQPEDKQDRFRALQFAIDNELKHYVHPIAKMDRLQYMMQKNLLKLGELWNGVADGNYKSSLKSNVIEFKPKEKTED